MTKKETNAAKLLGRKGGSSKSEAKVRASRDNGKLGGRPKQKWLMRTQSSGHDEDSAKEDSPVASED